MLDIVCAVMIVLATHFWVMKEHTHASAPVALLSIAIFVANHFHELSVAQLGFAAVMSVYLMVAVKTHSRASRIADIKEIYMQGRNGAFIDSQNLMFQNQVKCGLQNNPDCETCHGDTSINCFCTSHVNVGEHLELVAEIAKSPTRFIHNVALKSFKL